MSKALKYIDIHSHLNFPDYDDDLGDVIGRANFANVGIVNVGTSLDSSREAVDLAHENENMWATVGIHPTDVADGLSEADFSTLTTLAKDQKVVAIGECGLDYFHGNLDKIFLQKSAFERHIELANSVNKPLMLHIRNGKSGGNAYAEALEILHNISKVRFNFHFFAGSKEDLKNIIDARGTVSFTGVITFTSDYDELVRYAPLDRIMSETDCPFVAPIPYRGKRNEPSYVVELVKSIARIRGDSVDKVSEQLLKNARSTLGIF